ncbi:MAG: hypothetical protein Kow002_15930 [Anaerolineales bacterium]
MKVEKALLKSLLVMADIIEARDPYTGGHVWRVSQFAKLLATKVGLSKDQTLRTSIGGYLHDIGKVGIPDSILCKKGKLTEDEFEIIKTHPLIGARLICEHPLGTLFEEHVLYHHERVDGKGYAKGVNGEHFSLQARIIGVADAFDAMTSTRAYRAGMSQEVALSKLEQAAGSQFDAQLVDHMIELGQAGDLSHVIGHSDDGIPMVTCPNCGPVIAVPRSAKDGSFVYCRACTGKFRLHARGETFEAEFTNQTGTSVELRPEPNVDVINDLATQAPKRLRVR